MSQSATAAPAASAAAPTAGGTFGAGPDALVVTLCEDAYDGDAQANIHLDGALLTATPLTVKATRAAGASQAFTFNGTFGTGSHTVGIEFMNDAWGGTSTTDRNLWVNSVTLNGAPATPTGQVIVAGGGAGTTNFTVLGGTAVAPAAASAAAASAAPVITVEVRINGGSVQDIDLIALIQKSLALPEVITLMQGVVLGTPLPESGMSDLPDDPKAALTTLIALADGADFLNRRVSLAELATLLAPALAPLLAPLLTIQHTAPAAAAA